MVWHLHLVVPSLAFLHMWLEYLVVLKKNEEKSDSLPLHYKTTRR